MQGKQIGLTGMIILMWLTTGMLYAQNTKPALQILDYYIDFQAECIGEGGFTIHFVRYQISNLKNHLIMMALALKQNGEWISATRLYAGAEETRVQHPKALFTWTPPDTLWFCYPLKQLEQAGVDINQPFEGYLIVTEASGKDRKDVVMTKVDINLMTSSQVLEGREKKMGTDLGAVEIVYSEALGDSIEIRNQILYYSAQDGFEGDMQGVSANFTAKRTTREKKLKSEDLLNLVDVFYINHFGDMQEGYGADPKDRYYPETLRFKDQWGDKTVVYRSNPNVQAKPKPSEFDIIVAAIIALKDKYF